MFETTDISPRVGTEIKIGKADLTSGKYAAEIEALLKTRSALVFRGLDLSEEEQLEFANTIGTVTLLGDNGLSKISLDPTVSDTADYTRGAFYWHIDGANDTYPAKATMLTAKTLSEWGGDTLICNTYAAYDDLLDEKKEEYSKVKVRHALEATQRMVHPDYTHAELMRWRGRPSQTHPLVWHHKDSGLKSLVMGATAYYVHDMSREDSDAFLAELMDYATQDKYVYRHKWTVGDLLVWDNTGTMHRADTYSLDSKRLMNRTTLEGEEALA